MEKVRMGPLILTALCLWSCILVVTPLEEAKVGSITNYMNNTFFKGVTGQYAYYVKFTSPECQKVLQTQELKKAMQTDLDHFDIKAVMKKREIYVGNRMVAASYKPEGSYNIHSEYRLLNPYPGSTISPIEKLLQQDPKAGCVVFFSLNSPCVSTCTAPDGPYNIVKKLEALDPKRNPVYDDRAFAYNKVFKYDAEKNETQVWDHWSGLNKNMALLCCRENNCIKCFKGTTHVEACFTQCI